MSARSPLGPWNWQAPIVDPRSGLPTPEFQRWLQQTRLNDDSNAGELASKADKSVKIIAGTGLTGGGDLSADRTLALTNTGVVPASYTSTNLTVDAQGRITAATSGSGGGGGSTPTLRGSNIQSSNGSSYVIPFPGTPVAGDVALIFGAHGYNINVPADWFAINLLNNLTNIEGASLAKVLTAGDVAAGSVTLTTAGVFNGVFACVVLVGSTVARFEMPGQFQQNASGASTVPIGMVGQSTAGLILMFAANRAASNNTFSAGPTSLQTINATNASAALSQTSGVKIFNSTASFSSPGSGYYTAVLSVVGP